MERIFLRRIEDWNGRDVLSVLGPTGSGKTSSVLAEVRRRFPSNPRLPLLVSVDSVAVFRGLDIGSAKPSAEERAAFSWAGLDLAEPDRQVTAADFARLMLPPIEAALQLGRPIVLVGGSHFYERALVEGMSPGEASDEAFAAELNALSSEVLHARLLAQDPRWSRIHVNDRYRLVRFLDLTERQGFGFDELNGPPENPRPWKITATLLLGADAEPDAIREKMRARIRAMMDAGWMEETRRLRARFAPTAPGLQAVGYREIVARLAGQAGGALEEAILTSHMQLAKKQRTWLRGLRARAQARLAEDKH